MFTSDSPLDTSVITNKSQWLVVRLLPCLHPYAPPLPLPNPRYSTLRHVHTGRGPIPSSKQGHENNYKKINTGMRCHLVSRLANTPLGNVPAPPPQCTNPAKGRGVPPPPLGCPPTCLTHPDHLLRFAGQSFRTALFLRTRMAFVSHDRLWLAYCFPQHVISGSILHILRKRGTTLCFVFAA